MPIVASIEANIPRYMKSIIRDDVFNGSIVSCLMASVR
jgi:hypothetical protein